eukprot:scaffold293108_cov19-Prasinocladus_malaysianus.AAC.1
MSNSARQVLINQPRRQIRDGTELQRVAVHNGTDQRIRPEGERGRGGVRTACPAMIRCVGMVAATVGGFPAGGTRLS